MELAIINILLPQVTTNMYLPGRCHMMSVQPFLCKACSAYTAPKITYRKQSYHVTWLTAPTTQNTNEATQMHRWIADVSKHVPSVLQKCYV